MARELTPGAVAAHAAGRPLASSAARKAQDTATDRRLCSLLETLLANLPDDAPVRPHPDDAWQRLRRTGWVTRLRDIGKPEHLVSQATAVLAALPRPPGRADRRRLANTATGSPHALDEREALAGLVLALLAAARAIPEGVRARAAWSHVGVDCDDLLGGLLAVGIAPDGWHVPACEPLTLPPRVLARCAWPRPTSAQEWVFVTENPSVTAAAIELAEALDDGSIRLVCTAGTPSQVENAAIARLTTTGWNVAVRADFDPAGINHVAALLDAGPAAHVWRMTTPDYLASLERDDDQHVPLKDTPLPPTPWDPTLAEEIASRAVITFEESLLDQLVEDLRRGCP